MLTIATWYWKQPGGRTDYQPLHVNIWADMVRRNLTIPHRIACVTDLPDGIDPSIEIIAPPGDFEDIRIPTWGAHMPQCLRRIAMFRPDAAEIFGERFVSMDMDCVISGSLDPLFDRDEDFVMYRGTHAARPYNGSMLLMTAGARPQVYEQFTPEGAVQAGQKYLGSDQAWTSHILGPGEAVWDATDGVHAWGSRLNVGEPRVTFFLQPEKPWSYVGSGNSFCCEHYRRDPQPGKALILGYAPTVWDDVEKALDRGPFDAVIASPEAAHYWPRPVDAIAHDDDHALRLARMMGFEEYAFCGRQIEAAAA